MSDLRVEVERWCSALLLRDPQWQRTWWERHLGRELRQRDYALAGRR